MSVIWQIANEIFTIIPVNPKKFSIIFKEIMVLKFHGYMYTILTSSKIICVFGKEIFKKVFEELKVGVNF